MQGWKKHTSTGCELLTEVFYRNDKRRSPLLAVVKNFEGDPVSAVFTEEGKGLDKLLGDLVPDIKKVWLCRFSEHEMYMIMPVNDEEPKIIIDGIDIRVSCNGTYVRLPVGGCFSDVLTYDHQLVCFEQKG